MHDHNRPAVSSPLGFDFRYDGDSRSRDGYRRCIFPSCGEAASDRYDTPLCQPHLLSTWLLVEEDMRAANCTPDVIRESHNEQLTERRAAAFASATGSVYYLRIDDYLKIGYTRDLYQRMAQYPPNAEVLAHHPGSLADEKQMHQKFAVHLASGREWFRDCDEIREHIAKVIAEHGQPWQFDRSDRRPPGAPVHRRQGTVRRTAGGR